MATKKELDKKVLARLAMSEEKERGDWAVENERLIKRKQEAAKAMASDEQKKIRVESEKIKQEKLASQKRLEDLRKNKKNEEEIKKKDIGLTQKEEDLKAEKKKLEKIEEILKSQAQIQTITKQKSDYLKPLKTLSSDTIKAIKNEGLTSSKIAINSQNIIKKLPPKQPRKIGEILIFAVAIIFILASIGVVSYFIITRQNTNSQPIITKNSLLFADKHTGFDLTGQGINQISATIVKGINDLAMNQPKSGSITDFYFTEIIKYTSDEKILEKQTDIPAGQFIASSTQGIPSEFSRFLENPFMLGIYQNGSLSPFFIFKTQNYGNLADAMLKNESTIISNLYRLTGTNTVTDNLIGLPFKDKTVQNMDLRIAIKPDGETIALYGFIDLNTVLIAQNEEVFNKLLDLYKTRK
ncbi:MAG: hypothetical protein NTV48_02920 [Candidatus Vogelbacteria bacterium]|nr:hypothetical protein [Candidatus Vogelbacteria bacterium]